MSSTVERTRFGWARWAETDKGIERTYTVCEPGVTEWQRDLIQTRLFSDDRAGLSQVASRWLVRGIAAALVISVLVGLIMGSAAVIIPLALALLVAAAVLVATLPNLGEQLVRERTITVRGESCRLVSQIAAVLDRIEPAPSDVDRDDQKTMWRLAHTDPEFLADYGRTVREWEVSHDRLRATRTAGQDERPATDTAAPEQPTGSTRGATDSETPDARDSEDAAAEAPLASHAA